MYYCMGRNPAASSAATTGGYYHSLSATRFTPIPMIRLSAQWWNLPMTFNISPFTTQLSLPYSSTECTTALYLNYASWLILLPPILGWDIMGYESDPLSYYLGLNNCSYYIILNYAEYQTTPPLHLPCPDTTISSSGSSRASAAPRRRVHRWGDRPHFQLWLPAAYWWTLVWFEVLQIPLLPPRGVINTNRLPHLL